MNAKDYYDVLGVSRTATDDDLKKAYRRLALKYHPDRNPGDKSAEDQFKTLNEAYAALSDTQKRRQYDMFGHAGVGAGAQAGPGGSGFEGFDLGGGFGDIFNDVFSDFFGAGTTTRSRRRAERGADFRYNLEINLEEAVSGGSVRVKIPRGEPCTGCRGTGARNGTAMRTCATCGGAGQVRHQQGLFSIVRTCHHCRGEGRIVTERCPTCQGKGHITKEKVLSVKIPAGIENESVLRLSGEGERGTNGGPPGDLYVMVTVRAHPLFKRDGDNLVHEIFISFVQAALGTKVEVPTLTAKAKMEIPPGSQSGAVYRVPGQGVPHLRGGGRGDLLVRVKVEIPRKLTKQQRQVLEEFARLTGEPVMLEKDDEGFIEKVKTLFQ